jgi:hypothetical protein
MASPVHLANGIPRRVSWRANILTMAKVCLLTVVFVGCAHTKERAILHKTVLQPIITDLVSGNVKELRILYIGYDTTTRFPVSERDLESRPIYLKDIFLPIDESRRTELVDTLRRTQLKSLPGPRDLRCSLVFYGNERRRLCAICLEGPYLFERARRGTIDGYSVKITRPVPKWIERRLHESKASRTNDWRKAQP